MYGRFDVAALLTGAVAALALLGSGNVFHAAILALTGGGIYVAGKGDERVKKLLDTGDELTGYLTLVVVFYGGTLLLGNGHDLAAATLVPFTYGIALTTKEHIRGN